MLLLLGHWVYFRWGFLDKVLKTDQRDLQLAAKEGISARPMTMKKQTTPPCWDTDHRRCLSFNGFWYMERKQIARCSAQTDKQGQGLSVLYSRFGIKTIYPKAKTEIRQHNHTKTTPITNQAVSQHIWRTYSFYLFIINVFLWLHCLCSWLGPTCIWQGQYNLPKTIVLENLIGNILVHRQFPMTDWLFFTPSFPLQSHKK